MTFGKCLKIVDNRALSGNDFKRMFEAALNKIPSKKAEIGNAKIALAISGGSDSMALAALASEYLGNDRVVGLIVDHQLKNYGVSEEPVLVQENLKKLGIRSDIIKLSWDDEVSPHMSLIPGKIMVKSRENRYRALYEACKASNISLLMTGHNLEDDIVTMFFRFSRMSGIDGLAGMKQATIFPFAAPDSDSKFILRPLLTVPKSQLITTCLERNISWTRDGSNDDLSFRRNECLQALIQLQSENESISTEALAKMLGSFKNHRVYIHDKVSEVFEKSVILSKNVGDATLILNNPSLIKNNYLFNRVLTAMIQFTTVSSYPPKTPSLNRIYHDVFIEYNEYQRKKSNSNYHHNVRIKHNPELNENSSKRINLAQHTLAGAMIYALSKNDIGRRLANFSRRSNKNLTPGPALLIQREYPSKKEMKEMIKNVHDFSDEKSYLWDNRIFVEVKADPSSNNKMSLIFGIQPLNTELIKEFERATIKNISARKNLYSYLGMTPGSHLHTIPVFKHIESGYIAIPTLHCFSEQSLYTWKTINASIGVIAAKFTCLP